MEKTSSRMYLYIKLDSNFKDQGAIKWHNFTDYSIFLEIQLILSPNDI
jgi:hypothetical protein